MFVANRNVPETVVPSAIEQASYFANVIGFATVVLIWFIFAGTFFLRKKPESAPDAKREPRSWLGLILQGVGFAIVWAVQRAPFGSPLIDGQYTLNIALQVIAIATALGSIWLATSAIRELGKQWSLAARLVEDHRLVTTGVYQIVRHPIYTAMFGMMVATGLVLSHWISLAAAIVVFLIGTRIRTNFEEALLKDAFSEEFIVWKEKVPGLIPFVKI